MALSFGRFQFFFFCCLGRSVIDVLSDSQLDSLTFVEVTPYCVHLSLCVGSIFHKKKMSSTLQQRVCIKFCVKNGFNGAQTLEMLKTCFGNDTLTRSNVSMTTVAVVTVAMVTVAMATVDVATFAMGTVSTTTVATSTVVMATVAMESAAMVTFVMATVAIVTVAIVMVSMATVAIVTVAIVMVSMATVAIVTVAMATVSMATVTIELPLPSPSPLDSCTRRRRDLFII